MDILWHYLQIILLGIIEGVTEFLPISSTGHLLIAEALGLGHQSDLFNVVIQAGAILAVLFIYGPEIIDILLSLNERKYQILFGKLVLATSVTLLISGIIVMRHYSLPETISPVAWATLIGGFVILGVEFIVRSIYARDEVSWFDAVAMGFAQVLAAVFPGTSRSGATIMTGLILGVKRPLATEFSFLIGIPTMFAASAYEIWKLYKEYKLGTLDLGGSTVHQVIIDTTLGFIISAIVAFYVVKWLLRFVQSHTFNGFALYRILLGGALLVLIGTHVLADKESESKKQAVTPVVVPSEVAPAPAQVLPDPNASATNATSTPMIDPNAPAANPVTTPAPVLDTNTAPQVPAPVDPNAPKN